MLKSEDIEKFVDQQGGSIRIYFIFTFSLVLLGLVILFVVSGQVGDGAKVPLQLGGGFIASLSGLPIKEIVSKKEKIQAIKTLQNLIARKDSAEIDEAEKQKYNDLAFEILKKSVLL